MINWFQIICMLLATPMIILWLILYVRYNGKMDQYTAGLKPEDYPLLDLYFIGMGFVSMTKLNLKTRRARIRIKEIAEVRGEKYAEYFYFIIKSADITFVLTLIPPVLVLAGISGKPELLLLGVCVVVLLIRRLDFALNDLLDSRREELTLDLPDMLSKMALLINSGMVLREAWVKVAHSGERVLYQEMQITENDMRNGKSDLEAFRSFADRCSVNSIRKIANMLIQNMQKGNKELAFYLNDLSREMWEQKKAVVRQKGETASTKLLLPMGLIFIGVMALVVVPVFLSGF